MIKKTISTLAFLAILATPALAQRPTSFTSHECKLFRNGTFVTQGSVVVPDEGSYYASFAVATSDPSSAPSTSVMTENGYLRLSMFGIDGSNGHTVMDRRFAPDVASADITASRGGQQYLLSCVRKTLTACAAGPVTKVGQYCKFTEVNGTHATADLLLEPEGASHSVSFPTPPRTYREAFAIGSKHPTTGSTSVALYLRDASEDGAEEEFDFATPAPSIEAMLENELHRLECQKLLLCVSN